jgi:opacity protein-like surface antigen
MIAIASLALGLAAAGAAPAAAQNGPVSASILRATSTTSVFTPAPDAAPGTEAAEEAGAGQRGAGGGRSGGRGPGLRVSVFFHVGLLSLTASDSFKATLGDASGLVFGGGGELSTRMGVFFRADVSRFKETGERVFVSGGQVYPLGIPLDITMTPIEFPGGYRFFTHGGGPGRRGGPRILPYAGAGVGIVRYKEESKFDQPGEQIDDSYTSYHVLGGVDVPITRRLSAGVEFQHRWVPDALGAGGASKEFGETDLGGNTFRAQVRFFF